MSSIDANELEELKSALQKYLEGLSSSEYQVLFQSSATLGGLETQFNENAFEPRFEETSCQGSQMLESLEKRSLTEQRIWSRSPSAEAFTSNDELSMFTDFNRDTDMKANYNGHDLRNHQSLDDGGTENFLSADLVSESFRQEAMRGDDSLATINSSQELDWLTKSAQPKKPLNSISSVCAKASKITHNPITSSYLKEIPITLQSQLSQPDACLGLMSPSYSEIRETYTGKDAGHVNVNVKNLKLLCKAESSDVTEKEFDSKKEKRRQQNRTAARRCRNRKKECFESMIKAVQKAKADNIHYQKIIALLQAKLRQVVEELRKHSDHCGLQINYVNDLTAGQQTEHDT